MMCEFEVEDVYHHEFSFEDISDAICRKIARIIVFNEEVICTF